MQSSIALQDTQGLPFRLALNEALQTLITQNAGPTEPNPTYAFQWWADTTTGILKQRNAANNDWVEILDLATGRPVGSVAQTSTTGALLLAEGTDAQRPAPADIPAGVAAVRGNSTSLTDYFLELWDRPAAAWKALVDRVWVRKNTLIQGQHKDLRCSATGTNALISVSADQLVLESNAGEAIKLRDVNLAINTATVGANGLDTGVLAANTWYSVWVISDGVNVRGLISLSATAPTMPAGFTYKCQVWDVRTDGTANKFPLAAYKERNKTRYKLGTNVAALPLIASGVAGTYANQPTFVTASVVNAVPASAISIALSVCNTEVGAVAAVAPNPHYTNPVLGSCAPLFFSSAASAGGTFVSMAEIMLESQNIYYVSNGTGNKVVCYGWEDCL